MKIILIGNQGMLGRDLQSRLQNAGYNVKGLDIDELDITQPEAILPLLEPYGADLVINCASYTAVDKAEAEPELAFAVNRDGPANLSDACKKLEVSLIHISTDYVFDGNAKRPYREDDPVDPLGVYGQSKWAGEKAVRSRLKEYLIVRTAWLYGVHGNNFVKTILKLAREKEELTVVADQKGCPTWTGDLADALVAMAGQIHENPRPIRWGTYHFCGNGFTTWYDFAEAILKQGRLFENLRAVPVVPITTAEYPTPAQRPKWAVLDCTKIERVFGIRPKHWQEGLRFMLEELYNLSPACPA
jgi:dTDP-4-dehydrorhamnose reductase